MALITATQVIDIAFTNSSTDTALVRDSLINVAELQYIKPALGKELYDLLVSEYPSSWTGLNETLYTSYVQPALAYFVKLKCLPDMNINTTSQGLMSNNAEFSNQVASQMRAELAESTKQIAETYLAAGVDYIEDNLSSFVASNTDQTSSGLIGGMLIQKGNDLTIENKKYPWRK